MKNDIERIYDLRKELETEEEDRTKFKTLKNIYGIILADVWKENDTKIDISNSFENKNFIENT